MPDITTIAACSTALAAIMAITILLSWFKDGRSDQRNWVFAPFGLAVPAGVLLTFPDILPGPWGLALGWFFLTLVYGTAWQAARVMGGRQARPLALLLPCIAVLVFSLTLGAEGHMTGMRMLPRALLFAMFNGLAAREFGRMRSPRLPSATTLYWIFSAFFLFDLVRSPFSLWLPAPFGAEYPQVWSIALFNFLIVLEGSLLGVFVTALGREQLAEGHYQLASIDPLTDIGNRRAFDDRIERLKQDRAVTRPPAIAVIDIDNFKTINDQLGHAFGDLVIANTARIAREVFGKDNVFRIGGEEFAAIVHARRDNAIVAKAETMRARFEAHRHCAGNLSRHCTLSIGLARLENVHDHETAFKAADRALYMAKRLGRNQTIMLDASAPAPQALAERRANVGAL
ncbi:MAG: diguanylate cyclase [Novosphingobium sp.]|nr:diguanylate cyclase [Novosphingobium sp.]